MIKFLHSLSVIVFCTINLIECSLPDELKNYYDSSINQKFNEEWKKYRHAFENEIASNLREGFGTSAVNIYEPDKQKAFLLARGFYLTDGVVMVYFHEMVLRELPALLRPVLNMELSSNFVKFDSRLGRMFIDTTYYVARNSSSIIYASLYDQRALSPFSLQQVDTLGKVVIIVEDCLLSGITISTLSGDSVALGHNPVMLTDCKLTVEISTPNSEAPPVIAPYFPPGPRETIELILARPIREELQTKLQGAMYSYINTSVLFGNQVVNFRNNQQKLFKSYSEFMTGYVANMNEKTMKANKAQVTLPDYEATMDSETDKSRSKCHVTLTDIIVYGLDTAYVARAGGPYNNGSTQTAAEAIIFSSMQIRGRLTHANINGNSKKEFAAELTDVTVIVVIAIEEEETKLQQIHFTGWRSLEYSVVPREMSNEDRHNHQSLVHGHILNKLPLRILNHVSSILGHGPIDTNNLDGGDGGDNGGDDDGGGDDNGGGDDRGGGDDNGGIDDNRGGDDNGGGNGDEENGKSHNKNKEFFSDDILDDKFFSDDNFFSDEVLDKNFFNDSKEIIDKNFFNSSEEILESNFFNDSKEIIDKDLNFNSEHEVNEKITTGGYETEEKQDASDDVETNTAGAITGIDDKDLSMNGDDATVNTVMSKEGVYGDDGKYPIENNDAVDKSEVAGGDDKDVNLEENFFSDDFMEKDFFSDDEFGVDGKEEGNHLKDKDQVDEVDGSESNIDDSKEEGVDGNTGKDIEYPIDNVPDDNVDDRGQPDVNERNIDSNEKISTDGAAKGYFSEDKKPLFSDDNKPFFSDDKEPFFSDDKEPFFSDDNKPFFSDDNKPFFSDDKKSSFSDDFLEKDFFSDGEFGDDLGSKGQGDAKDQIDNADDVNDAPDVNVGNGGEVDEDDRNIDGDKEEAVEDNDGNNKDHIDNSDDGNDVSDVNAGSGGQAGVDVRNIDGDEESNNGNDKDQIDNVEDDNYQPNNNADGGGQLDGHPRNKKPAGGAANSFLSDDNKPFFTDEVLDKDFFSDFSDGKKEQKAQLKAKIGGNVQKDGNRGENVDGNGGNDKHNVDTGKKNLFVSASREDVSGAEFLDENMFSEMDLDRRDGSRRHVTQDNRTNPINRVDHIGVGGKREELAMTNEKNDTIKSNIKENFTDDPQEGIKVVLPSNVHNTRRNPNAHTSENEIRR